MVNSYWTVSNIFRGSVQRWAIVYDGKTIPETSVLIRSFHCLLAFKEVITCDIDYNKLLTPSMKVVVRVITICGDNGDPGVRTCPWVGFTSQGRALTRETRSRRTGRVRAALHSNENTLSSDFRVASEPGADINEKAVANAEIGYKNHVEDR